MAEPQAPDTESIPSDPGGEPLQTPQTLARRQAGRILRWAAVYFVVIAVVVELGLRLSLIPALTAIAKPVEDINSLLVEDPYVLRRTIPNHHPDSPDEPNAWLQTNRYGFRAPDIPMEKPPGVKRVFCLGGSALFGATSWQGGFLPVEETYAGRLQVLLNNRGGKWEVYNAGMLGETSLQGLRLVQRDILPLDPDVIIASYFWNDIGPAPNGIPDSQLPIQPQWVFAIRRWIYTHWYTGRAIIAARQMRQDWLQHHGVPHSTAPAQHVQRVSASEYANNLIALIQLCSEHHVVIIVMMPPMGPVHLLEQTGANVEGFQVSYAQYREIVKSIAEKWHVPFADGGAWLSRKTEYFNAAEIGDIVHFNAAGHERVAEGLSEIVWFEMQDEI